VRDNESESFSGSVLSNYLISCLMMRRFGLSCMDSILWSDSMGEGFSKYSVKLRFKNDWVQDCSVHSEVE
jgi:hypothetical protein